MELHFFAEFKKAATASKSVFLTETVKAFDKVTANLAGLRRQLEQHSPNIDECINAQEAWDACNLFLQTDDIDTVAKAASATADKVLKAQGRSPEQNQTQQMQSFARCRDPMAV